jgi:heme/copper-type cytochrome/quinol oxidase subunit 4
MSLLASLGLTRLKCMIPGYSRKGIFQMAQATQQQEPRVWELFVELRKEIVESQKIRAQIVGFKITVISSAIGLIVAANNAVPRKLLVVPALAAIFFDFLIQSYSFSIKRIGRYCRENLEPVLFGAVSFSSWEEFMSKPENRQSYSMIGNLGITVLAAIPAIIALTSPFRWSISLPLLFVLACLLVIDWTSFFTIGRYGRKKSENKSESERTLTAGVTAG